MGEMRDGYKILARKPREKRTAGRSVCRWADNIKEIGVEMWILFN
jgi:hypothetical protein